MNKLYKIKNIEEQNIVIMSIPEQEEKQVKLSEKLKSFKLYSGNEYLLNIKDDTIIFISYSKNEIEDYKKESYKILNFIPQKKMDNLDIVSLVLVTSLFESNFLTNFDKIKEYIIEIKKLLKKLKEK